MYRHRHVGRLEHTVSTTPLRRLKHAASGAPRAANAPPASAIPVPVPVPAPVQQLAAIATPEQSRAWRWTRNNSVEHEVLPPLSLLPALQPQRPHTPLAPAANAAQKQSEPPAFCRMPSGTPPAPNAAAPLSLTRREEPPPPAVLRRWTRRLWTCWCSSGCRCVRSSSFYCTCATERLKFLMY